MSSQVFHSWQLAQATTVSQHLIHRKNKTTAVTKRIDFGTVSGFHRLRSAYSGIGFNQVCVWLCVWSYIPCPVGKGNSPKRLKGSIVICSSAADPGLMKSSSCPCATVTFGSLANRPTAVEPVSVQPKWGKQIACKRAIRSGARCETQLMCQAL